MRVQGGGGGYVWRKGRGKKKYVYIGSERLWNKDLEMIPRKYLDCFIAVYEKLIFS